MSTILRNLLIVALGLAIYLALHMVFVMAWAGFFSQVPWPGYEDSMALGLVEPWFINSPRSLWLTRFVLFATAFAIALATRRAHWSGAFALWLGAGAGIAATWATTSMRGLEGGTLGYVFYPFRVALPILLGTGLGALAVRTLGRRRVVPSSS